MEASCEICHERPPTEGFKLCDRCKGFDPLSDSREIPAAERHAKAPATESTLELCMSCGSPIEPYPIGKALRTTGECQACYHKRRYGPDHKTGGMTKDEKAATSKAWREARKKAKDNSESKTLQPGPREPNMEECNIVIQANNLLETSPQQPGAIADALSVVGIKHLTVAFVGDDEAMYQRLKDIATKERRSMEQQVLYFLDRVVEI